MKNSVLIIVVIILSFGFGFAFNAMLARQNNPEPDPKKVTGIGGIFFKCKDPKKTREWYHKHLGLNTNQYGAMFEWYESPDTTRKAMTQWSAFPEKTKYFDPSEKDFMINYRVENLASLVEELKHDSVTVVDSIETFDYGKFVHIMDAEGNKIELWEPVY